MAWANRCVRLDPATGRIVREFTLPSGGRTPPPWGYINVFDRYLVGGADPLREAVFPQAGEGAGDDPDPVADDDAMGALLARIRNLRGDNDTHSSSRALFVLDRHAGRVLWNATARSGFRHNAVCIGAGRLYAIDRLSGPQVERRRRRGEPAEVPPRLVAFDLATGRELWSTEHEVFGTWLSYSAEHDVLVEAGRRARDTMFDEPRGMRARRGSDGAVLWEADHSGPAMIDGRTILMEGRACDLLTGEILTREHPITGARVPWTWSRTYGCNTPMASRHLLTFRSGAAGFFDRHNDGGTGNFGGFRSSCTNNLVVAGGILVAPEYTRTCTCSYQNQTSVALVPMAEAEMWTFFGSRDIPGPIRRLGINLGAPGDRRAPDGALWLEHPSVGGASPAPPVRTVPERMETYRRHSSRVKGPLPWVAASGAVGVESLVVTLDKEGKTERSFTVRLHFAEPEERRRAGERVFHVSLQGQPVLRYFDVVREAGGPLEGIVREFKGVRAKKDLTVVLTPARGDAPPVLAGLEIVEEGP